MKNWLILPLALAGQLVIGRAEAQGRDVTVMRVSGPQLGVRLEEVDADAVARLKLKEEKGALITEVLDGSAAAKAGLKKDDVIVKFQGESILTAAQLVRLVRDVPAGRKVDVDILRAGAPIKVTATLDRGSLMKRNGEMGPDLEALGERPGRLGDLRFKVPGDGPESRDRLPRAFNFKLDENGPARGLVAGAGKGRLGINYTEIEGQLATYFKSPKDQAVLVDSVVEGSAAAKAGVKAGDLITKLGDQSITDGSELRDAIADAPAGKDSRLSVWRDGRSIDLSVRFEEAEKSTARRRRPVS